MSEADKREAAIFDAAMELPPDQRKVIDFGLAKATSGQQLTDKTNFRPSNSSSLRLSA